MNYMLMVGTVNFKSIPAVHVLTGIKYAALKMF